MTTREKKKELYNIVFFIERYSISIKDPENSADYDWLSNKRREAIKLIEKITGGLTKDKS